MFDVVFDVICQVEGQELMTAWQASIYRMMARDR